MKLQKYIFTTKRNDQRTYLYIQNSTYINKRVKTISHCIGNVSNFNDIMIKLMNTSESLFLGETILFELFEKLGINRMISGDLKSLGADKYQIRILQFLMATRILRPFSKRKLTRYLNHSLMKFSHSIDHVNDVYDAMKLTKNHESYFRKYVDLLFKKLNYDHNTNYFDTTNIYFYSDIDEFRTLAYSKDGKRGLPHIAFALACTEDRIPLYYDVYPGNTADITCIRKYIETKPDNNKIFIFDAGCYSFDFITQLESEKFKYKYICGADISKYEYKTDLKTITRHDQKWDIREAEYNGHRIIEAYNIKHHEQKIAKIEGNVARVKEFAQTVTGKTVDSKREKVYDLIASLGLKSQIKVKIIEEQIEIIVNNDQIKKLKDKAKKIVLMTNLDFEAIDVLERYLGRIEVEKAFQYLKNPLSIRPVFHGKKVNIRAHAFIVMLGYLQLTVLRYYLSKNYNIELTLDELLEELIFATCVAIEPKKGIFMTYVGKQVEWIKKLIIDLNLPIISESCLQFVESPKRS